MEEIKISKVEEIEICKVLLSQAFGQAVEFSTKADNIKLRLLEDLMDKPVSLSNLPEFLCN